VTTAVLSTTTKAKARKDRKEGKTGDVEMVSASTPKKVDADTAMEEAKEEVEEKKDEPEADFQELNNPSRVLK